MGSGDVYKRQVEERGFGVRKKDIFEENKELQSSLFLAQSYQDAWADYSRSLKKERFARWDYVVLTASNEEQAEGFKEQIKKTLSCVSGKR